MSNDKRKPMSWKNPGAGGGNGPAPSQKREWHPATTKSTKPTGPRRRSILWPTLAGAILLGLIVAAVLLLRPAHLPRIVVAGPANADTLSTLPNIAGANAAHGLADWAGDGKDRPHLVGAPAEEVNGDEWARGLDDGKEDSVVLSLNLHGGVDASGQAFLWLVPPKAPEPTEKQKLRVSAIISRLGQLPDKKRKLLIVDATQISVSYAHGQLHNDFARALKQLDMQIEQVPNLVVLCASDEDQRSWVSEEWQTSIFSHLLLEAAKGAAGVDRVTVADLFKYLQKEVPAWTLSNRGENQTPILLPAGSGIERAKKIDFASVSSKRYERPDARKAPGMSFSAKELATAWERRDELAKLRPEAVAPHRWRVHLDTLLRTEQMYRDGLPAADVQSRLARLAKGEDDLKGKPWSDLSSLGNALPMPAALGPQPATNASVNDPFPAIWDDAVNDRPTLRQTIEAQGVETVGKRLEVCARLIDHLIREERPDYLAKAAKLLDAMFVGSEPAPVEAHLIRLLARDFDPEKEKRPSWPLVKLALQTHRLAEEVAVVGGAGDKEFPASEQVYPWIKDAVITADIERLFGLDCFFSNDPAAWPKGEERLNSAAGQYREILKRAQQVREAMTERNGALAELPYYGRWVGGLRDEFDAAESQMLLETVERTAEATHRLSNMIEESKPARLGEMVSATTVVREGMTKLRDKFTIFVNKFNGDVLIPRWHHLDNALRVPFIPAKRRIELLGYLRGISGALNVQWQDVGQKPAAAPSFAPREAAQRHGRVALALLGSGWVNDPRTREESGGQVKVNYDELRQMVTAPKPEWWVSLDDAGDQIGRHWRALAGRIDALTEKAARSPLDRAVPDLAHADTLARMADSTSAFGKEHDAVVDHRRYRLHTFLLNQARRSIEANWAAPELAAKTSYGEATARRLVDDAQKLILLGAGSNPSPQDQDRLLVDVSRVRDTLQIPIYGIAPTELTKDLTPEQKEFRSTFVIRRPVGRSPGYPVLRIHSGGPARVPDVVSATRRLVMDFADAESPPPSVERALDVKVDQNSVALADGFVKAELWHRGHHRDANLPVQMNRDPTTIWAYHPPEQLPGFAVRAAPDQRNGAVAIVLDWSASMNIVDATKTTRYAKAVSALETVLDSLPEDTQVSITLFPAPGGRHSHMLDEPQARNFKKHPEQLVELIKRLGRNEPAGQYTPAARAIVQAAEKGLPKDFIGYKTIVVLTDGDDTFDKGDSGNVVRDALANKGIALKMIFFQATADEYKRARAQFEAVESLDPPGELVAADDKDALVARLVDAMRPRVQAFKRNGDRLERIALEDRRGLPVTLRGSNLREWSRPLPPGPYTLRAVGAEGKIRLERGDRLLLELAAVDRQIEFRQHLYVPDAIPADGRQLLKKSDDGQNVHAGLGECRLIPRADGDYDLELFFLLERERKPEELQVTYPHFVWAEVGTQNGGAQPPQVTRLDNELYFPSPAYRVRVTKWQPLPGQRNVREAPSRPTITIWSRDGLPGRHTLLVTRDVNKEIENKPFDIDGQPAKLDFARIEGDYLRVKITHKPGEPLVFLRVENLKDEPRLNLKEEHRFYANKGLYTATFGPLNEAERKRAFTLAVYSMADMKRDASKVELRPNVSPADSKLLGQDTPAPVILEK
jgi:hypothetical protein